MTAPETVTVRGENGVEFDVDLPTEGTPARRQYDAFLASGRLTVVSDPEPFVESVEGLVADILAVFDRLDALDDDAKDEVKRLVEEARPGDDIDVTLPDIPPPGDEDGTAGRPKVRDDIEVWRTYRKAQGHETNGLTKTELQQLPDTPPTTQTSEED